MPHFALNVPALVTGAVAGTYTPLLGLKFGNTAGHRGRLKKLILGGGGVAPQDLQISFRLRRGDNAADGTSTAVNVNTIGKADAGSLGSNLAAIGANYTVAPTALDTGMAGGGTLNTRGTIVLEWTPEEAPVWGPNQTLVLEAAPGSATAATLEATAEWEEF